MAKKYLVSVGDIVIIDIATGQAIIHGKSNISTAMSQTMAKTEARGGKGNPLLYTYYHDRLVEFTVEMPTFSSSILAMQSGATVGSDTYSVVATECVVLVAGEATLDNTPTGNVTFIFDDNDASVLVTPTVKDIVVPNGLARKGVAIYDYNATADRITVETAAQPDVVQLVITADVYDADNSDPVQTFQVNVPRFKLDGSYDLTMGSADIGKQTLKGEALRNVSSDCTTGEYYYTATYINTDTTTTAYTILISTPDPMSFTAGSATQTQATTVLGYRGPLYTSTAITDSCVYTVTSGCTTTIWVAPATGVVSACATAASGDNAVVGVTYWDVNSGSLTDSLSVVVA